MRHFILALIVTLLATHSFSQDYVGYSMYNNGGYLTSLLNPANIVNSRMKVDITLLGLDVRAYNDYAFIPGTQLTLIPPNFRDVEFNLDSNLTTAPKDNQANVDAMGAYNFGFMFSVGDNIGVGFGIRPRFIASVRDVNRDLIDLAQSDFSDSTLYFNTYEEDDISLDAMGWTEYALSYGMTVMDNQEHYLKVGGNLKLLQGYAKGYLQGRDLSYQFVSEDSITNFTGEFTYGANDQGYGLLDGSTEPMDLLTGSSWGFGVDIGAVYEWRPKWADYKYDMDGETDLWRRDKNKYLLKAGLSFHDIGAIKYTNSAASNQFRVIDPNFDFTIFEGVEDLESLNQIIEDNPDKFETVEAPEKFSAWLPAKMNLFVDYNIWNDFYVSMQSSIAFTGSSGIYTTKGRSSIYLIPRYDHKWFGFSIPMGYRGVEGWKVGLNLRLGPLFIGTTDLPALLTTAKEVRGINLQAGLRIPIPYGKPKDKDGDKVSDKKDICKEIPGVWEFQGCPDTDGDGIQDSEDYCPLVKGIPEFQGCPDTDGDGIRDELDKCPLDSGLVVFDGCPDFDGDSIPDINDACPFLFGLKEFNGCPDTDGDGMTDYDDDCPEIFGPKENHGCPWPDTDGDSLIDREDKCPFLAGPVENLGCPYVDTDKDSIFDKDDACPETPGPRSNNGCPVLEQEQVQIIKEAFDNLEFDANKAKIKTDSYTALDKLAGLLRDNPEWLIMISGHTDNVGDDDANMRLSKERAQAVMDYLIDKGVGESQGIVRYFGEEQPIASNDTPEGRQKNRRVEMEILFK